LLLDITVVVIT